MQIKNIFKYSLQTSEDTTISFLMSVTFCLSCVLQMSIKKMSKKCFVLCPYHKTLSCEIILELPDKGWSFTLLLIALVEQVSATKEMAIFASMFLVVYMHKTVSCKKRKNNLSAVESSLSAVVGVCVYSRDCRFPLAVSIRPDRAARRSGEKAH